MKITRDQIDPDAVKVVERLRRFDHQAYTVGGCVRDLLLGRKPKDFDVATSATPQEIRRLFRNCRIIGRRFRLAHIFFGPKIIETSTFRANPREFEDEQPEAAADPPQSDLLIRRDNVFGSAEQDARRRDFTMNGLFYDIESGEVIDHVGGLADLEARLVRTIGDPDIRFREDPVRILRAVKFAARLGLDIEPETYRRMLDHALEIQKCAQARVSEEFYRLMRAGAASRSIALLQETSLLKILAPELHAALAAEHPDPDRRLYRDRFLAYLSALDRTTIRRDTPPSNALVLATMLLPPLRDALHPDTNAVRDIGRVVSESIQPLLERLKASRRDSELARQILLALRYVFPSSTRERRRPRLADREFFDDALRLHEIVSDAEAAAPELAGRAILATGDAPPSEADEQLVRELETPSPYERARRDRRDVDRDRNRPSHGPSTAPLRPEAPAYAIPGTTVRTPIPDLNDLRLRPRADLPFLGTGAFGGRWSTGND